MRGTTRLFSGIGNKLQMVFFWSCVSVPIRKQCWQFYVSGFWFLSGCSWTWGLYFTDLLLL